MSTGTQTLDTAELEQRVKEMYREVADEPHKEFHFETGRPPGMPQGQEQRLVMSIAATATFTTAGPHAAVAEVNGEELGRARFYLMEGVPEPGEQL